MERGQLVLCMMGRFHMFTADSSLQKLNITETQKLAKGQIIHTNDAPCLFVFGKNRRGKSGPRRSLLVRYLTNERTVYSHMTFYYSILATESEQSKQAACVKTPIVNRTSDFQETDYTAVSLL